jgi:hypothetical protein
VSVTASDDNPHQAESDQVVCEECGDGFDSERGLAIHSGRMHDSSEDDQDEDDDPDEERSPALPKGLTEGDLAALADLYDDVDAIADDMEVAPDRALALLEQHELLDELHQPEVTG